MILGSLCSVLILRAKCSLRQHANTSFVDLATQQEAGKHVEWTEYKKGDWHAGAAWIQDEKKAEARIYTYRKKPNRPWLLVAKESLPFNKDKLDYVQICYPEPIVMLINTDGLLIRSIRMWDVPTPESDKGEGNALER
jgi:hypothetical protein